MADIINREVEEMFPIALKYRRHFHENPELSNCENETAKFVSKILTENNIEHIDNFYKTGIVGMIEGAYEGPTIMLRADMDALPICEETGLEFSSKNYGVMHACGHDIHTANLLGSAIILNKFKDKMHGNIKLNFQPAEETSGANGMIEAGVMKNPDVDFAFGMHVDSNQKLGQVSIEDGPVTSYPRFFSIKVKGRGGHGSMPHLSLDPIAPAIRMYEAISDIPKKISPFNTSVIQICSINAGSAPAAIPSELTMLGTTRTHDENDTKLIEEEMAKIIAEISKIYGVESEFNYGGKNSPVINDPEKTARVREVLKNTFEARSSGENFKLAGEDFSVYSKLVPSTFIMVGCNSPDEEYSYPIHNSRFNPDERVLKYGMESFVRVALDYLGVKL